MIAMKRCVLVFMVGSLLVLGTACSNDDKPDNGGLDVADSVQTDVGGQAGEDAKIEGDLEDVKKADTNLDVENDADENIEPSDGTFVSGLDQDKQVDALSDAEKGQFREKAFEYMSKILPANAAEEEAIIKQMCTLMTGFSSDRSSFETDAELQAACSEARDVCVAENNEEMPTEFPPLPEVCAISVKEAEDCLTAQYVNAALFYDFLSDVPVCEELSLENLEDEEEEEDKKVLPSGPPEECVVIEERCPDF